MGNRAGSHSSSVDDQEDGKDCDKMAVSVLEDQDPFSCSICLDPLEEPVTIPCGHSYCMDCIRGCWDQEDDVGVYSCPQCRQTFQPRPALNKNTMFAEVVERLRQSGLGAARPGNQYAKPGDVVCDVCTGRKQVATKTCLVCFASYCEMHLKLHDSLNSGLRHTVVDTVSQGVKRCVQHGKKLKAYCRSDHSFICRICAVKEHKGHDIAQASKDLPATCTSGAKGDGPTRGTRNMEEKHMIQCKNRNGGVREHRHGKNVHYVDSHVKPGLGSSGQKKKRKHVSGHGKSGHKSSGHGGWH